MDGHLFIYSYSGNIEKKVMGVGYMPATDRQNAKHKLKCAIEHNSLDYKVFVNQKIPQYVILNDIVTDPDSERKMRNNIYKRPSPYMLNHFMFGEYPEDYEQVSRLITPPEGYIQECIAWFAENDYYEMCAKLKQVNHELADIRHSVYP